MSEKHTTVPKSVLLKTPEAGIIPEVQSPEDRIWQELREAEREYNSGRQLSRQLTESGERGEQAPKIIRLGPAVGFIGRPTLPLSARALAEYITEARTEMGIPMSPASGGTKVVGFVESREQAEYLAQRGDLSLGLAPPGTSSFLSRVDNEVWIQGCPAIIGAATTLDDPNRQGRATMIVSESTPGARLAQKNTWVLDVPISEINFHLFQKDLPEQTLAPLDHSKLKTEIFRNAFFGKGDLNDFRTNFLRGDVDGQAAFIQKLLIFFNDVDSALTQAGILVGGRETDSIEFIFTDIRKKRVYEKIMAEKMMKHEFLVKSVATFLGDKNEDVEVTSYNGRPFHLSVPYPEKALAKKEIVMKLAQGNQPEEVGKVKMGSYVFIRHTPWTDARGIPHPEPLKQRV